MPLSERQRAKNQQLVSDVFESLAPKIQNQFSDYNDPWIRAYSAMFNGASLCTLSTLETCDSIAKAWGKGNPQKSATCVKLFSLALYSRWERFWESSGRKTSPEGRKNTAGDILKLFGDYSEDSLTWFVQLDKQFHFESDCAKDNPSPTSEGFKPVPNIESKLLQLHVLKACGDNLTLDLSMLSFPMTWDIEFRMPLGLDNSSKATDIFEDVAFSACLKNAAETMVDIWRNAKTS